MELEELLQFLQLMTLSSFGSYSLMKIFLTSENVSSNACAILQVFICEQAFSLMKQIKKKQQSQLMT
jgi:hypothetical protein